MNERKSSKNDFLSLPDFDFDGDIIEIGDEDEEDNVWKKRN